MEIARRKLSSPQWWMCVWQHYNNNNLQRHVKDDNQQQHHPQLPTPSTSTSKMIHPTTCASPPTAAERPSVLDLSSQAPSSSVVPSLATLGSATVLDLSNPSVLNTLASSIVITPNTEQMLFTLSETVASQGLTAAFTTPITATTPTKTFTAYTSNTAVPLMVAEEVSDVPGVFSPGGSMAGSVAGSVAGCDDAGERDSECSSSMSMDSMDPMVARAVRESNSTGSLTPLIKTELKCTIQKKRILSGKGELSPEDLLARKDSHEQLSPEEEERRSRRRERNKLAAQKCRGKRKERANELEEEVDKLEESNAILRAETEKLEQEKEKLKRMLFFHDNQEGKCPKRQRLSEEGEEEQEEELLEVLMDGQTEEAFTDDIQIVMN